MLLTDYTNGNYTMRQLKLPLEIAKLIDISDPVYTFCVQCIDIDPMLCTIDGKNSIAHMVIIRNIRLLMPDTVLTIIIFIAKNTAWKNT